VLVRVRDSGVGLDPKSSERIFDAFYTTKPAGMGMGLSISRSIVQNHGGRIWAVPNDSGPGTTFQFTVPALHGLEYAQRHLVGLLRHVEAGRHFRFRAGPLSCLSMRIRAGPVRRADSDARKTVRGAWRRRWGSACVEHSLEFGRLIDRGDTCAARRLLDVSARRKKRCLHCRFFLDHRDLIAPSETWS
jgi:hypothetical protein